MPPKPKIVIPPDSCDEPSSRMSGYATLFRVMKFPTCGDKERSTKVAMTLAPLEARAVPFYPENNALLGLHYKQSKIDPVKDLGPQFCFLACFGSRQFLVVTYYLSFKH